MKVLLIAIFTCCLVGLAAPGFAQATLGPRVGVNFANLTGNEVFKANFEGLERRPSLVLAAVIEIRFNENFALQPEVTFVQKGAQAEESYSDPIAGSVTEKYEYNIVSYIEIPVLVKTGAAIGSTRFDLLAGPSLGYGLDGKSKLTTTINGNASTEIDEIDFVADHFSRTDLSVQLGAALSFALGEASLYVDARYLLGFTDLDTDPRGDMIVHNRGVALSAGALFSL